MKVIEKKLKSHAGYFRLKTEQHMIGTIDIQIQAHNPNFPLEPVFTFVNSSQSFRVRNVPKKIGKWSITAVSVNLSYPDNTTISKPCVLTGGVWVATVEGCPMSGSCENGFVVTASGIDENGQAVSNYVLGAGNLYVKELDGTVAPGSNAAKMYFYESVPSSPCKGDVTFQSGVMVIWDGSQWKPAARQSDPSCIEDAKGNRINADRTVVVAQFNWVLNDAYVLAGTKTDSMYDTIGARCTLEYNDGTWTFRHLIKDFAGWIVMCDENIAGTESDNALSFNNGVYLINWRQQQSTNDALALKTEVPTKTSALTNDSGFITASEVPTPDKIQDSTGNVIHADGRVVKIEEGNPCWYFVSGTTTYVMTGEKEFSEYYVDNRNKWQMSYDNNAWSLSNWMADRQGTWYRILGTTSEGNLTDTNVVFLLNGNTITLTWKPEIIVHDDCVALRTEVPAKTSDLTNDSDFATRQWVTDNGFAKTTDIKNATITLSQGGVAKGSFTLNQSSNKTIELDAGGGNGYTVTVCHYSTTDSDYSSADHAFVNGFDFRAAEPGLFVNGIRSSSGTLTIPNQNVIVIGGAYVNGSPVSNQVMTLDQNVRVDLYYYFCMVAGTPVHLLNGNTKPIESVAYDDDLIVWNFDEGKLDAAKPLWIKVPGRAYSCWETRFVSGTVIRTCGTYGHRFFSVDQDRFVYAAECEGQKVYTLNGIDTVMETRKVEHEDVWFYNIITKNHINLFASTVLTGCSLNNGLYPVHDMKFVKDNRAIRPYEEFRDAVPEDWYRDCRYGESSLDHDYLVKYYTDRKNAGVLNGLSNKGA